MKIRLSALFLSLVMLCAALVGCGGKAPEIEAEKPVVDMTPVPQKPVEEVYTGPTNPLTGLGVEEDLSGTRPYAIMLNNLTKALPQYGVGKADIIYEVPAEGGITRMMALYSDITGLGNVGSIRSARDYYIQIARGHDALYVHAGGSPGAYDLISSQGLDTIDGVNGYSGDIFWRDAARKKTAGYEHSLFLTAENLQNFTAKNRTMTHRLDYKNPLLFAPAGTPDGESAAQVKVTY